MTTRLPHLVDIGIVGGNIVTIQPGLQADGEVIDAGGRLVSPGFVETHIHLDKSCILDRLSSQRGGLNEAIGEVARLKAEWTPEECLPAGKADSGKVRRQRHHAECERTWRSIRS